MNIEEKLAWWQMLAVTTFVFMGIPLFVSAFPGPNAPQFIASSPVILSVAFGVYLLTLLFRLAYLAGTKRGRRG